MSKYPEHDRLEKVSAKSQVIGAFLGSSDYTLCSPHSHDVGCFDGDQDACDDFIAEAETDDNGRLTTGPCGYVQDEMVALTMSTEHVLAKYFDIDLKKLESEKRQMLKELQKENP